MIGPTPLAREPKLARLNSSPEQSAALSKLAFGIFAECINTGQPLQTAILAVYLSGLDHGARTPQEWTKQA